MADTLKIIEAAYAARVRGDKEAMEAFWLPDATLSIAGIVAMPMLDDKHAADATKALIDLVTFHEIERLDAVVDGNRAAIRWRVTLTIGDRTVTTEICDIWTLEGERGKALVQFADTALLAELTR
jgi:ketosteroid isomerase-like protein